MRAIILDSATLGLLTRPSGKPRPDQCRTWVANLVSFGARLGIPEIADFEVRRKLLHIGASAALVRLDDLKDGLEYHPITTPVMLHAAELWASLRRIGLPTAAPGSLDADCILAAQAFAAVGPGDVLTVAADNVSHLSRFAGLDARPWEMIPI